MKDKIMDVNIYPFSISLQLQEDSPLDRDSFMGYITRFSTDVQEIYGKDRVVSFKEIPNSNYIAGILLSFRDYEAHCKITQNERGSYLATVETIKDGAEYNFFVINKITLKGVWLTYFNAASISVLDQILRRIFNKYAETYGIEVTMKFKLKNKIRASMILSRETVEEALSKFNKISHIEYTERNNQVSFFSPDVVNTRRTRLLLKQENLIDQTTESILSLVNSGEVENTSVRGVNNRGKKETVNLDNIFRPWDTYDYDEITRSLENFDTDNLIQNPTIGLLLSCVTSTIRNRHIIEEV